MGDASEELEAELTADEWGGWAAFSQSPTAGVCGGPEVPQGETNRHRGRPTGTRGGSSEPG